MNKFSIKWLALIGLAFFIASCSESRPKLVHIQGKTMGTYYQVKYVLTAEQLSRDKFRAEEVQAQIDQRLELVNDQMSTYRVNSELSRFNQTLHSMKISDELRHVVEASLNLFKETNGAFDITVGPLVNLWGFGPDKKINKAPSDEVIAAKRQLVGSQYLSLQENELVKSIPELYLDLSAIAKGYGVDQIAEYLQQLGIENYLVDIGGELRLHGNKVENRPWTLAIERPIAGQNVQRLIQIGNNAIATSGDYRNYFEAEGIRYSHTIDPRTGKPITHKLVSVTVINKSSMLADGLATAITVLGPKLGLEFAKKQQVPAFLLVKEGDDFVEYFTSEFEPYLLEEEQ